MRFTLIAALFPFLTLGCATQPASSPHETKVFYTVKCKFVGPPEGATRKLSYTWKLGSHEMHFPVTGSVVAKIKWPDGQTNTSRPFDVAVLSEGEHPSGSGAFLFAGPGVPESAELTFKFEGSDSQNHPLKEELALTCQP